jgi:hypothetical protein
MATPALMLRLTSLLLHHLTVLQHLIPAMTQQVPPSFDTMTAFLGSLLYGAPLTTMSSNQQPAPWTHAATDMLHYLFITVPDYFFHKWDTTSFAPKQISLMELTPENLRDFAAFNIIEIDSLETYITTEVRVSMCLAGPPGPWIGSLATQDAMRTRRMDVNISNASSDSGKVEIAGCILPEDPILTHCLHFSLSTRTTLPHAPYFDMGIHRKAPTGRNDTLHLVV